jgi:hypothetical protein
MQTGFVTDSRDITRLFHSSHFHKGPIATDIVSQSNVSSEGYCGSDRGAQNALMTSFRRRPPYWSCASALRQSASPQPELTRPGQLTLEHLTELLTRCLIADTRSCSAEPQRAKARSPGPNRVHRPVERKEGWSARITRPAAARGGPFWGTERRHRLRPATYRYVRRAATASWCRVAADRRRARK